MKPKILLSLARMGGKEIDFVKEAIESDWVAPAGPHLQKFETQLACFLKEDVYLTALTSCTAALHLGLLLLGVTAGDEVICQSFTFAASANPIVYVGATPVFVDSGSDNWNMSPVYLEEAIRSRISSTGRKPKAIITVHLYGLPACMDAIMEIAQRYDIPILEDAAESLGSEYKGQKCGTFGRYATLSFNGNKMITTSGGGALVSHSAAEAQKALYYATQARDEAPHYQHSEIGYNYRMSNLSAGIGLGQMLVLDEHISRRRVIHSLYKELLSDCLPGVRIMDCEWPECHSNHWLTCILITPELAGFTREEVRQRMSKEDIETRPLWKPMHLQPVFANAPYYGDGTSEQLFNEGLCLPSGPRLSNEDVHRVVAVIHSFSLR